VPFFHHELVKQAVHAAMESPAQSEHVMALLKRCVCVCVLLAWVYACLLCGGRQRGMQQQPVACVV
jgi:hypothetical protein